MLESKSNSHELESEAEKRGNWIVMSMVTLFTVSLIYSYYKRSCLEEMVIIICNFQILVVLKAGGYCARKVRI